MDDGGADVERVQGRPVSTLPPTRTPSIRRRRSSGCRRRSSSGCRRNPGTHERAGRLVLVRRRSRSSRRRCSWSGRRRRSRRRCRRRSPSARRRRRSRGSRRSSRVSLPPMIMVRFAAMMRTWFARSPPPGCRRPVRRVVRADGDRLVRADRLRVVRADHHEGAFARDVLDALLLPTFAVMSLPAFGSTIRCCRRCPRTDLVAGTPPPAWRTTQRAVRRRRPRAAGSCRCRRGR